MGGSAKILERMTLFGDWVTFRVLDIADQRDVSGLNLHGLALALGLDQRTVDATAQPVFISTISP